MLGCEACVRAGDLVIIYHGYTRLRPLVAETGKVLHCKEGQFDHDSIIGAPYGTQVQGRANRKGDPNPSLLILRPTPDLWTQAVPRRTQIIYATDISVIVQQLRLFPGKVVAEAGTGSGSLTHGLANAVAPNGKVFSFDFHRARYLEAKAEFESHGLGEIISANWGDVCGDCSLPHGEDEPKPGYGLPPNCCDAIFLDVPSPWLAVQNALTTLKPDGMLCSFSPCIEQTSRLCDALRASKEFVQLRTVEVLGREHCPSFERKLSGNTLPFAPSPAAKGHSAFLTFARRQV